VDEVMRSQVARGHSAVKTAISWQLAQHQVARLVREIESTGARVPRISYEHLTEQPQRVLTEILEHAGLQWDEAVLTPRPNHVIGGGPNTKHGGKYSLEPSKGTRPPLPLKARLALKLVSSRYPGSV
jgi:hypothetical protein